MLKIDRIGDTKMMNNKLYATIISYTNANNIDVMFENGAIVRNSTYYYFVKGNIKCPIVTEEYDSYYKIINPNTKYKTEFLIDKDDFEKVMSVYWWRAMKQGHITGYDENNNQILLHRYLINAKDKEFVDHRNINPADNRKCNLRICSRSENGMNRNKMNLNKTTSKYKGVSYDKSKNKWITRVCVEQKIVHRSSHDNEIEAVTAYNNYVELFHGDFSRLNEIL
jgi:hypothetical protein